MSFTFELRPGARIRYHSAQAPELWREGTLLRPSANGEEWLVRSAFGRFWLPLSLIQPIPEAVEP